MEKVYISLGADCGGGGALREIGKKTFSFPFDWLVCFHSIHKPFQNDFRGFLEDRVENVEMRGDNQFNLDYNIRFFHREIIKEYEVTIQRRINRLLDFMRASDKELIFVRRSHSKSHHQEMKLCGLDCPEPLDEVKDITILRDVLISKYPNLKFKLNLFIQCPLCNVGQANVESEHINIRMSTQMHILHQNLEPWAREFVNWVKTL